MLPRSFLTKCSSLLSLVLRAWVVLMSTFSSVLANQHASNRIRVASIYTHTCDLFCLCSIQDLIIFYWCLAIVIDLIIFYWCLAIVMTG